MACLDFGLIQREIEEYFFITNVCFSFLTRQELHQIVR